MTRSLHLISDLNLGSSEPNNWELSSYEGIRGALWYTWFLHLIWWLGKLMSFGGPHFWTADFAWCSIRGLLVETQDIVGGDETTNLVTFSGLHQAASRESRIFDQIWESIGTPIVEPCPWTECPWSLQLFTRFPSISPSVSEAWPVSFWQPEAARRIHPAATANDGRPVFHGEDFTPEPQKSWLTSCDVDHVDRGPGFWSTSIQIHRQSSVAWVPGGNLLSVWVEPLTVEGSD
jgi:hypothetical protein